MKILNLQQGSIEWHEHRNSSIGGTRLGQVISGRDNRLIYDLLNECLNGYIPEDDYVDEDMQFGIDNEPIARELYNEKTGLGFTEVGMIKSDTSNIHHHSPDGVAEVAPNRYAILEIKCTMNGAIHMQRFFEGVDAKHLPQIINAFAVSDQVESVHWVSYCPFRPERPLVEHIFTLDTIVKGKTIAEQVRVARVQIKAIENRMQEMLLDFSF